MVYISLVKILINNIIKNNNYFKYVNKKKNFFTISSKYKKIYIYQYFIYFLLFNLKIFKFEKKFFFKLSVYFKFFFVYQKNKVNFIYYFFFNFFKEVSNFFIFKK